MPTTIKDIAQTTGFSTATVSRVLTNKTGFFNAKTAQKIRQAAHDLGYQKNIAATELVTQKSDVVAVIVNSTNTNFSEAIIQGIQEQAEKAHKTIIILYTENRNPKAQKKALTTAWERSVAGILLLSVNLAPANLELLKNSQIPFYFVSINFQDPTLPCITADDYEIGYLATQYLIRKGHQRIGLAGIDLSDSFTGQLRRSGYHQALADYHLPVDSSWIQTGDYSYAAGKKALTNYLADEQPVTAVIAGSDLVGIGILKQAHQQNLEIPQQLSVITIDGTQLCDFVQPSLTSVSQKFYQMGKISLHQLLADRQQSNYVSSKIVERESVLDRLQH
ncbi:LacI family DNA-binding transcriptional regulator [Lactobacillus sp. DCY120]|uniref:LacI family DNA-binding transcriptional regulator n=1 Tax=Bombilactobacillus apium TaxID=2675299 RepID=A0A850R7K5_9LACO|nr:LacI family DNA-binding transcriptional regulator [Bombilactobacillus apium]NVY96505.1 LacI family DNA-binding transcriptional regulator [Bombilactobacillus apium]